MELSIQELNEKISRIQEDHCREIMKLSSYCEKEFINMKKVNICYEESIKRIFFTMEAHNFMSVNESNFEFYKLVNTL